MPTQADMVNVTEATGTVSSGARPESDSDRAPVSDRTAGIEAVLKDFSSLVGGRWGDVMGGRRRRDGPTGRGAECRVPGRRTPFASWSRHGYGNRQPAAPDGTQLRREGSGWAAPVGAGVCPGHAPGVFPGRVGWRGATAYIGARCCHRWPTCGRATLTAKAITTAPALTTTTGVAATGVAPPNTCPPALSSSGAMPLVQPGCLNSGMFLLNKWAVTGAPSSRRAQAHPDPGPPREQTFCDALHTMPRARRKGKTTPLA